MQIVIGTKNRHKISEFDQALAGLKVQLASLDAFPGIPAPEENGSTFIENATMKAVYYAAKTGSWAVTDDSGLEVDALGGRPGIYSSRYSGDDCDDAKNNAKLLQELKGVPHEKRTARYRCVIALANTDGISFTFEDSCEGIIEDAPSGDAGFGYDPLFFFPQFGKTFASVPMSEKNKVSHRGKALQKFASFVASVLSKQTL